MFNQKAEKLIFQSISLKAKQELIRRQNPLHLLDTLRYEQLERRLLQDTRPSNGAGGFQLHEEPAASA